MILYIKMAYYKIRKRKFDHNERMKKLIEAFKDDANKTYHGTILFLIIKNFPTINHYFAF